MKAALISAVLAACLTTTGKAQDIAIALTDNLVEIDADFAGAQIDLFGALAGANAPFEAYDIIAVIEGPPLDFEVRALERRSAFWIPGEPFAVNNAPGVYITSATRDIDSIAPLPDQSAFALSLNGLRLNARRRDAPSPGEARYRDAFLDVMQDKGLYRDIVDGVEFKKPGLFTIRFDLPANAPVGDYAVSAYLYRGGGLIAHDNATLRVDTVGMERRIVEFAMFRPVSYGFACVFISLAAGWFAGFVFRKS